MLAKNKKRRKDSTTSTRWKRKKTNAMRVSVSLAFWEVHYSLHPVMKTARHYIERVLSAVTFSNWSSRFVLSCRLWFSLNQRIFFGYIHALISLYAFYKCAAVHGNWGNLNNCDQFEESCSLFVLDVILLV